MYITSGNVKQILVQMKPALSFILILFTLFVVVKAAQIATTEDGKKVLLKDDGTWKYATQSDLMAVKMLQNKNQKQSGGKDPFAFSAKQVNAPHKGGGTGSKGSGGQAPAKKPDGAKAPVSLANVINPATGFDFRKAQWGMTKAQVKSSEKAKLIKETQNELQYASKIAGMTSVMIYSFHNGRLIRASYDIKQGHVNPSLFYEDFEKLLSHMSKTYGAPATRDYQWKNSMYKNDKSKWGFAISIGFLTCNIIWKNNRSHINLHISGGKHTFMTKIDYSKI